MAKLRNHFLLKIPSTYYLDIFAYICWCSFWMPLIFCMKFIELSREQIWYQIYRLPPIKIFSQLTQAFLEILKSRIWSIRAATIIEHIWLCSLLFYHWVQWFNLQFLQCKMKYILKRSLYRVRIFILAVFKCQYFS